MALGYTYLGIYTLRYSVPKIEIHYVFGQRSWLIPLDSARLAKYLPRRPRNTGGNHPAMALPYVGAEYKNKYKRIYKKKEAFHHLIIAGGTS